MPAGRAGVTGRAEPAGADVIPIDRHRRRELERWAWRYAQAAVEIVGGDRPVSQLLRWTTRDVYDDLTRRAQLVARAGGHRPGEGRVQPVRPVVAGVHSCFVVADVARGQRARPLRPPLPRPRGPLRAARRTLAVQRPRVCLMPTGQLQALSQG